MKKCFLFVLLFAYLVISSASAWAGGLYLYEVSNLDVATASAGWAARAQDASTILTNPAGMTRLTEPEMQVGAQALYLDINFDSDSKTTASGRSGDASDWLPAGGIYYVTAPVPELRLGFGIGGYFGLGLDYSDNWVGRYYITEILLQGITFMPAAAYKVNDWLSIGAGVNIMYAKFYQEVAINNVPDVISDGKLEIKDDTVGLAANLGVLIEPSDRTRFGIHYMSESSLDFKDAPRFKNIGPVLKAALNAAGLIGSELKLGMTAPDSVMVSAYHELNNRWAIMGNVGWQQWSEFGKVDVTVSSETTTSLTADRNYDDTWHVAAGAQYRVSDPWLLSCGVAYDSSMVDDDDRTPDLPLGESWRFGLGSKYRWTEHLDLSIAYEFLWGGDLPVDVERGPLAGRVSGDYTDTYMNFINVALNWRF